jgi:hypothetical protein
MSPESPLLPSPSGSSHAEARRPYECDGVVCIPLTQGKTATVSLEDAEKVAPFLWSARKGKRDSCWYVLTNFREGGVRRLVLLHRFILGEPPCLVDHVDRNGLNCTRENLRLATCAQSAQNRVRLKRKRPDLPTGVYLKQDKPNYTPSFIAEIQHNKKRIRIGSFSSVKEAEQARLAVATRLFGNFFANK